MYCWHTSVNNRIAPPLKWPPYFWPLKDMPWMNCCSSQTAQRTLSWPRDSTDTPRVAPKQVWESPKKSAKKPFCSVLVFVIFIIIIIIIIIISCSAGVSWSYDVPSCLYRCLYVHVCECLCCKIIIITIGKKSNVRRAHLKFC